MSRTNESCATHAIESCHAFHFVNCTSHHAHIIDSRMSQVTNESSHAQIRHVTHERVMCHTRYRACHTFHFINCTSHHLQITYAQISHVTHKYVTSHTNESRVTHAIDSCHAYFASKDTSSHAHTTNSQRIPRTHKGMMSRIEKSCTHTMAERTCAQGLLHTEHIYKRTCTFSHREGVGDKLAKESLVYMLYI